MREPGRAGERSLRGLGLLAFIGFLIAGLAAGVALRHHNGPGRHLASVPADEAGPPPNVVVVMTDDQTLDQMRALPRTRKLIGRTGVSFRDFYVTDPLCCPSRATFFSGQYAHNTGVISNGGPNAFDAFDQRQTLGVWLQRAGYRTAFVGKYLNGYGADDPRQVPPGWDDWQALVDPSTQNYVEYEINDNGTLRHYGPDPDDYKTTVLGRLAVHRIREAAAGTKPFFLYVGFNAPHAPSTPAPGDVGAYAGVAAPRSPAFNEADVSDKPSFIRDRPLLDAAALARIDDRNQRALESLAEVDRQVERIVGELKSQGMLGNTYLLFTSDNGYLDGEHRIEFGKLLAYDPSSRVPLLIRGPGIPNGKGTSALVGNVDLAPTIAQIAGADPGLPQDGRSLLQLAADPDRSDHRPLLIESLVHDRSTYYGYPYAAIRTDRYLYVDYATGDEELYDMKDDPYQLESLAGDPAYAGVKRALAAALAKLRDCAGADCERSLPRLERPVSPTPGGG